MRFHHSTRRGRNRPGQHHHQHVSHRLLHRSSTSTSKWSQLGYCRETSIHFNRRLPVAPPDGGLGKSGEPASEQALVGNQSELEAAAAERAGAPPSKQRKQRAQNEELSPKGAQIDERLNRLSLGGVEEQGDKSTLAKQPARRSAPKEPSEGAAKMDLEGARQRLVAQVEKHPFWSNKAARRMQLTGLEERRIYIYELVSFCERRDLEWRYQPYRGALVPSIPVKRLDQPRESSASQPATPTIGLAADSDGRGRAAASQRSKTGSGSYAPIEASSVFSTGRAGARSPSEPGSGAAAAYALMSSIERTSPSPEQVWAIEAPEHAKPEPFVGRSHSSELASSSFVKRCHGCQGRGRLKCTSCYGVGYEVCISCSGKGTTKSLSSLGSAIRSSRSYASDYNSRNSTNANSYYDDNADPPADKRRSNGPGGISSGGGSASSSAWLTESCHFCHGAGQKRCWVCAGKSYNHCLGCLGSGHLRCYLNLNITWLNHRDEIILNNLDCIIPKDRLRLASGLLLADQTAERLAPMSRSRIDGAIGNSDEAERLQEASKRLLDKQRETYHQERLIKQRHKVTQIECHVVTYEWKQRSGHFVIYGDEKKVYIAKYPFKSLCNIT